jgi:hypothetical protein
MTKNHPHPSGITSRPAMAAPLSVSITTDQLAWIDARRVMGSLSRSAVLRQVIDQAIAAEPGRKAS